MERNVVSLELAERLKAAGFPQKTLYYFKAITGADFMIVRHPDKWPEPAKGELAAPTAQEIANQFRDEGKLELHWYGGKWAALNRGERGIGDTMAEALGELYCKLHEETDK